MKIQMVDLRGQYDKIKKEIDLSISEVLSNSSFINGPQVGKFEKALAAYAKVDHCISCANGTDALQIAMMALDLKRGDEIIAPTFTYIATIEAAALLGIKIVLADSDPLTFNLSIQSVKKAITSNTKAIVPVHLYGQCANMEEIKLLADQHSLFVIEDAAQAIGSHYTFKNGKTFFAGAMGTIATTSFFPSKNLGCYGDGGAIFTNDANLARKARMIANHGQEKKYYHDMIGVNSRLDTLQAAVLQVKLNHLNKYIEARQRAASFYDQALKGNSHFTIPHRDPSSTHSFHQYTLIVKNEKRDKLKEHLEAHTIPSMIYYPVPVHLQEAYLYLRYKKGDFPEAEKLAASVISIPMHTELEEDQLNYIANTILNFFK
jgi:UDP-2-acetamido-2-deoxy-ribo-hexuluronate aminotransferase